MSGEPFGPVGQTVVEPSPRKVADFVAEIVRSAICEAASVRGKCCLALAGGTTPHLLYQKLASEAPYDEMPWGQVEIFIGDERDVPHDNADSNYGMIQRTLLDNVPVPPTNIHPMPADADDLSAAAEEYEQDIRATVPAGPDGVPRFDLILLGVGGDGHTASLFPGTDALQESQRLVVGHFVPVLSRNRMTFTFPLINAARNVVMMVTGDDKAQAVASLAGLGEPPRDSLPASRVQPTDGKLIVVMDHQAARLLEEQS